MAETLRTLDAELVTRTQVDSSGLTGALVPVLIAGLLCTTPIADLGTALAGSFVEDAIVNGVTTKAPSQNAVYDALALKADASALSSYLTSANAIATYQPLDADLTSWSAVARASGFDAWAASPSSSNLGSLLTDKTGTGVNVFATSPTLVTPVLGVAEATSVNKVAFTAPATSATLTIADGKTLTASNTLTFTGTDGSTLNVGTGGALGTAAYVSTGTSGATIPLLNGVNVHSAANTFTGIDGTTGGAVTISNGAPALIMYENDAAADEKYWRILASGGDLFIGGVNDAYTVGFTPIIITRAAGVASAITLTATQVKVTPSVGSGSEPTDAAFVIQAPGASNSGPYAVIQSTSASPAVGDVWGLRYFGKDSAANDQVYGSVNCAIVDPTSTTEDSELRLATMIAGTFANRLVLGATATFGVPISLPSGIATLDVLNLSNTTGQIRHTGTGDTFFDVGAGTGTAKALYFRTSSSYANLLSVSGAGLLTVYAGVTAGGGRSFFSATGEPYAVGLRYTSSGAYAYIGASNSASNPNVVISNTSGSAIITALDGRTVRFDGYGAGTLVTDSSGNITASSDAELKTIKAPFTRGLVALRLMDAPVIYNWNELSGFDQTCEYVGFTAQGVHKGIPEAIGIGQNGMLTLQERPILAAHHNAILELEDRISALQEEVNELKLAA